MGVCINILDIPILEDRECRAEREENATEKFTVKQENKTARTIARSEEDVYQSYFRNFGTGETPLEGSIGSVADAYGQIGAAVAPLGVAAATGGTSLLPSALTSLLGGFGLTSTTAAGNEEIDLLPLALAAGAAVVVLAVVMSGRK